MDSQEAANRANIETTHLTRKLVYIGYATFAVCALGTIFAAWAVLRSPDIPQPTSAGPGITVLKWLPVIILGSCSLTLAVALFVITVRRWRYGKLEADYKLLRTQTNNLKEELASANSRNLTLSRERDDAERQLESQKKSYEISRSELKEFKENADAQTRTYDMTFKGMREEMDALKQTAETEASRANAETQDKRLIRELKDRAEAELTELGFLKELARHQAKDLSTYVRTEIPTYPHCGELQLTGKHLCILLGVSIQNESVFDIAVEEKQITGQFILDRIAFREQAAQLIDDFRPPLHDLKLDKKKSFSLSNPCWNSKPKRFKDALLPTQKRNCRSAHLASQYRSATPAFGLQTRRDYD